MGAFGSLSDDFRLFRGGGDDDADFEGPAIDSVNDPDGLLQFTGWSPSRNGITMGAGSVCDPALLLLCSLELADTQSSSSPSSLYIPYMVKMVASRDPLLLVAATRSAGAGIMAPVAAVAVTVCGISGMNGPSMKRRGDVV